MKILTFDTSLDKTYVTLSRDGEILSSEIIENHNEKYHSAFLMPTIVSVLKENKITMLDIDVVGTNVGPGSFTGIRACVTVARVFAQQLELPLVGVSSMEILSYMNNSSKDAIVVMDARKNQFYTAVYDKDGNEIQKPSLVDKSIMLKMDFYNSFIISDLSTHNVLEQFGYESVIFSNEKPELGLFLNKIVYKKVKKSQTLKDEFYWAKLKPLYLQAPPISLSAKANVN
ncbi:MAG: tRNA (adenosine(37)-N6)-threonylcarbamoyltransferase complex dimerization subunit type 1 TsaB [Clostridium sp.]|nr:tRNA (adenosine(37)-N6)-threonylcarbamoyltransferase complex dimerization subunit type 1 TsaB [Clostridium sp.]